MKTTLAGLLAAATILAAPPANAAPDPHIPDIGADYCPGGGAGITYRLAYCDGIPYPDGTFWHIVQSGVPVIGHPYGLFSPGMQCVVNTGGPIPAPAPPGGCGGAVK